MVQTEYMMQTKLIRLSTDTYYKLAKQGTYGDTMDAIVQRLLSKTMEGHQ